MKTLIYFFNPILSRDFSRAEFAPEKKISDEC